MEEEKTRANPVTRELNHHFDALIARLSCAPVVRMPIEETNATANIGQRVWQIYETGYLAKNIRQAVHPCVRFIRPNLQIGTALHVRNQSAKIAPYTIIGHQNTK